MSPRTPKPRGTRRRTSMAVATTLLASLAITVVGWVLQSTPAYASAQSALSIPGRGATVPFTEYEAEDAATNGTKLAPTRAWDTLAGEASGRSAVTLSGTGKYVQFTLTKPANAVDVHYSIPDSAGGSAYTTPLAVYVGGAKTTDLTLTNKYSWFYGSYPFQNTPGSNPHHMYDDVRTLFGSTLAAGTTVKFQVDTGSTPVTIDTADFESTAPLSQPAGSLTVTSYGADPSGAADSTSDFQTAINAASAQGKTLWIPAGTYRITGHLIVNAVTVKGAGPWYSVLTGTNVGIYGVNSPGSVNVHVSDLAVFGEVVDRDDAAQVNGFGGAIGGGSTITNVWVEHTKVGFWFDGPFSDLTVSGSRVLDTTADGLNLHDGITGSTVTNNFLRNTGDDGLAAWSDQNADANDTFSYNTVELPMLANNIALYGGHDNTVSYNVVSDTQTQGGGIHVANRFSSVPLAGTTTILNDTTLRAGVLDPNWQFGVGALWFDAQQGALNSPINVTGVNLVDSSYEGIQTVEGSSVSNVTLTDVDIDGAGTFALQLQDGGSMTFNHVTSEYIGQANQIYSCEGTAFTFNLVGTTNGAWKNNISSPYCNGSWPAPIYTYPNPSGPPASTSPTPPPSAGNITLTPSTLTFGTQNVGTTSAAQTITVKNTGTASAALSGVSASGDFAETSTCGSSLAVNATCTATVTFRPTAGGTRTGGLTVVSDTPGSPNVANLTGTGFDPNANLAQGRTVTDTGHSDVYVAANAVDGNTSTYWESTNNSWPQSLTVDLGAGYAVGRVVLSLPPAWGTRTETLSVLGSTDNGGYTTLSASAGRTFDPSSGNTVTITFTAASERYIRLTFTGNTGWPAGQISELGVYATGGGGGPAPTNLALGKTMTASSTTQVYTAGNANDGNASSYWESANNAFPQWLQVDLGASTGVSRIVLTLPPSADWAARTETLTVQGSATGSSFATVVGSAGYTFDPATGNTVTITFTATTTRYLRLNFTGNTGWPAGQLSEFQVWA
jgi:hypothetical protein